MEALPVNGVGLALMNDAGHQGVIAATDGPARLMEELQFTLGEGPCLDASRSRRPIMEPDLAGTARTRWPGFGPAVLEAGIAAIFAFPLQIGAIRLGILDLYRATPGALDDEQLGDALAYGDAAAVVLLRMQSKVPPGGGLHPLLGASVQSHAEVHQATGAVAVQAGVSLSEALLLLQAHAYAADRSLRAVARDVLEGALRFQLSAEDHE
ncbi:GAF domain-containing protein [Nocardioides baekrokdamisoli]|uniref:GAF domain-containing protein n=2 Tax=Nocardioides baekrokdamisoli TaxID=1804624 RepID=A0A3G9IUU7_9ACTN|nr:GAF domain-containing protein [Nocardioides baekrokdamisoli]